MFSVSIAANTTLNDPPRRLAAIIQENVVIATTYERIRDYTLLRDFGCYGIRKFKRAPLLIGFHKGHLENQTYYFVSQIKLAILPVSPSRR